MTENENEQAASLEGVNESAEDVTPEIAAEVQPQEETGETEAEQGPEADAAEDPVED